MVFPDNAATSKVSSLLSSRWKDATQRSVGAGAPIAEPGEPGWCHLVEQGLAASYVTVDQNRPTCVGLIGPGELIGLADVFGSPTDPSRHACAVVACHVISIPLASMQEGLRTSPALWAVCARQLKTRFAELEHIAACNARHVLPGRCAHWLLKLHARLGDTLPVTHEFLASVLGVRRAGVTVTLQALQRNGAIGQQRGSIAIRDIERLRHTACSCPIGDPLPALEDDLPAADAAWAGAAMPRSIRPGARLELATAGQWPSHAANPVARIDGVLRVCRSVIATTREVLGT